jgi:hypothetical protein
MGSHAHSGIPHPIGIPSFYLQEGQVTPDNLVPAPVPVLRHHHSLKVPTLVVPLKTKTHSQTMLRKHMWITIIPCRTLYRRMRTLSMEKIRKYGDIDRTRTEIQSLSLLIGRAFIRSLSSHVLAPEQLQKICSFSIWASFQHHSREFEPFSHFKCSMTTLQITKNAKHQRCITSRN